MTTVSTRNSPTPNAQPAVMPGAFDARRNDWRFGGVVYQVFLDRFAPSRRIEGKRHLYAAPRTLRPWEELPAARGHNAEERNAHAELDFWGGDLDSLAQRLDYVHTLGIDVLYLNPVFEAFTNHKYDASDFRRVDPQFGTVEELKSLAGELHRRGMKLMLDGVFNHMGRRAPLFQRALADPSGPERDFFTFGEEYRNGYLAWRNVPNLPELNLENSEVREFLWSGENSIVRWYLREVGIDGWRLDVAPDIGFAYLKELTAAAHETRSDSAIIGECWNYPEDWLRSVDGILNLHTGNLIVELLKGRMAPAAFGRVVDRLIADCGIEGLLRSHLVLDNHDTPRITTILPSAEDRHIAAFLQFTLPGSPVIYYGSELGMEGGADPTNRAPMRWDLLSDDNAELAHMRRLIALRKENPALAIGDCRVLDATQLVAFIRRTDRARETMIAVVNPTNAPVDEIVPIRESRLMDAAPMECLLTGDHAVIRSGLIECKLPPRSVRLFRTVDRGAGPGYSMFKRV